jgi:TolA-binding protein
MRLKFIWRVMAVAPLLYSAGLQADPNAVILQKAIFGTVVAVEGEVYLNGGAVLAGQNVFEEDKIKTATGKIEIDSEGSRFLIGPQSEITLGPSLANEHSFMQCIKGTLRCVIHKLLGESFQVKTQFVTVGIRGTEFILHATPAAGVLFTEEGSVRLEANGGQVQVEKMQMSQAGKGMAPLAPEAVNAQPSLNALLNEIRQYCDLSIPAEISGKKELNDIIARWDLNFSYYLVDKEEYEKAQSLSFLAFLIAEKRELKAEARFWRGTIFLRFQRETAKALEDFEEVIQNYQDTPYFEQALYHQGFAYYDLKQTEQARNCLERYLRLFPQGKFNESARAILKKISGEGEQ